jgi:hypothetical protein
MKTPLRGMQHKRFIYAALQHNQVKRHLSDPLKAPLDLGIMVLAESFAKVSNIFTGTDLAR